MHQCGESVSFDRNEIIISDCRRPFRAVLSNDGCRAIAVVPRVMLNSRAPWLRQRAVYKFSNTRFLDLARHHMMRLVSDDLSETESSLLTENLCNLLALSSAAEVPLGRLQTELQLGAVLAFCQQNLHFPGLSPQFVAEHFGLSVRTLHLRFQRIEQTFGRWLLETRLDACSKALRDPLQRTRSVSEIAYSCGFNDLSHFNRSFRARFAMAPSQWRHEYVKKQ
jgi:AraC-like DNA-binding protein